MRRRLVEPVASRSLNHRTAASSVEDEGERVCLDSSARLKVTRSRTAGDAALSAVERGEYAPFSLRADLFFTALGVLLGLGTIVVILVQSSS
jgi:hypothetical protein